LAQWVHGSEVLRERKQLVDLRVAEAGEDRGCSCAERSSHAAKVVTHCLHLFAQLLDVCR
jgi:hypothetical protein